MLDAYDLRGYKSDKLFVNQLQQQSHLIKCLFVKTAPTR